MFEPTSDRYLCSSLSPCKRTYLRKRIEAEPDVQRHKSKAVRSARTAKRATRTREAEWRGSAAEPHTKGAVRGTCRLDRGCRA